MFETVAPAPVPSGRRLLYRIAIPVSLGIHLAVAGAAFASALWNVVFPMQSPRYVTSYSLTALPDPPPPSPPPPPRVVPVATAQPQPVAENIAPEMPVQDVAPTVIPDTIPIVSNSLAHFVANAVALPGVAAGVSGGTVQGQAGGEIGGKLGGIVGAVKFPDDGRVHIEMGEKLPLIALSQDPPIYPPEMKKKGIEDAVIVRYTIGIDGRVTDVTVIDPAKQPAFNEATLTAIRRWRFRPMIKDGKRTEVVHDMLVNFEIVRR
jgi:TonB family protein